MISDCSLMRILPDLVSIEDEIQRLKDSKVGEELYSEFLYNTPRIEAYETILDRSGISYRRDIIGTKATYTKL